MRIICTLFFAFIVCSANAQLTNGLVAHWNFNGNANDVTGNGHHGSATNVVYVAGSLGTAGTAAQFDGTSSFVTVPYHNNFNVSSFSVCAKVKINGYYTGTCQGNIIFQRGSDFQSGHYTLQFSDNMFNSCQVSDTSKHCFYSHVRNKVPFNSTLQYLPTIVSARWYCVINTFQNDTLRVYIDGVLKNTVQLSSGALGTSTDGVSIGASRMGSYIQYPYWLNGSIDDLRLYNRALTPSEISSFCGLFDTAIVIKDSIAKKNICMDDTFHLSYTVNNTFNSGNTFTAQLSDASGNFNTPVNIGTVTSSTNGTIVCNVPTGLTPGNGYRVRIVSTNPVRTSDVTSQFGIYTTLIPSVSVSATPSGPYAPNQFITFISTPVNAGTTPTFQWYRNGNAIPGANDDSLYINTLNDGDSIYVVVISSNPCPPDLSAQSNKIHVSISSSVNDIQLPNLNLYPNPNNGSFIISANSITYTQILLEVINPLGQVIVQKQVSVTDQQLNQRIGTGQIPAGIYLLRISADGRQRNIRFTVAN